jgi:alpha-tubulin suppressor-like RCC1 family protein
MRRRLALFALGNTNVATILTITISPPVVNLQVGQPATLTVTALSSTGTALSGKTFTWSSSNTAVASVSSSGVVTALTPGSTTISATSEGVTASAIATITANSAGFAIFSKISAGQHHTCALTAAGKAYCWGDPTYGQTGTGDVAPAPTPRAVAGSIVFTSISAGSTHTCGLTASGDAYCWGRNLSGELGDGTTTLSNAPVLVSGGLKFSSITASSNELTCGLTTTGAAYCWGQNSAGQVGDNTTVDRHVPTAVAGGLTFAAVSPSNGGNACGLTVAGKLYCWGFYTGLGDGSSTSRSAPIAIASNLTFTSIVIPRDATGGCGIVAAGAAYCRGQAITPGGTTTATPAAASGQTYTVLAPAQSFTCGLVSSGTIYCSGLNDDGQLGDGTRTQRLTAGPVSGSLTFTTVTTGGWHACGLTTTGAAYCWGLNDFGEVGTGVFTQGSSLSPQAAKAP